MQIDKELLLQTVSKVYGVSKKEITGPMRHSKFTCARKMICLVLKDLPISESSGLINRTKAVARLHRLEYLRLLDVDTDIQNKYDYILSQIKSDMTIKLKPSQLESLQAVFEHHLGRESDNISAELINLHIRDISERVRKRILNKKKNLNLDEKQIRAYVIWHLHYSENYRANPHAYLTFQDIINQIKPDYTGTISMDAGLKSISNNNQ